MQAFIEYIVKSIVKHPEAVSITEAGRGDQISYELRVHPEDVGTVVGRDGGTINAIRELLKAAGGKKGVRYSLKLIEDQQQLQ